MLARPMAALAGLNGWRKMIATFLAGVAMGFTQAPWSLWPLFFVSLPIFFGLLGSTESKRSRFGVGWAFGLGYFCLALSWIVEPFMIDAARYGWMAPFALLGLAGGLALIWGVASTPRGGALQVVAFLGLAELFRAYALTGFPWALMGQGWVETPVIQLVSVIGVHGVGLLTVLAGAILARGTLRGLAVSGAMLAAMWGGSLWLGAGDFPDRETAFNVRIVQPNAAQQLKWLPEFQEMFFQRLLESTAAEGSVDMVIWPETAVNFLPDRRPDLLAEVAAAAHGADVVFGARHFQDGDWFNSLFVLDSQGEIAARYDKHHLVPFGEYLPLNDFANSIGWRALADVTALGFSEGDGPQTIETPSVPAFSPLICYEAVFPVYAEGSGKRPEFLLQITNDAWFGNLSGPYQHLAQARIRAIEQGLPLIRAANTGVSAIVNARGQVVAQLPLGVAGHLDGVLPAALVPTIYARTGDWLIFAVLGLLALATIRRPFRWGKWG